MKRYIIALALLSSCSNSKPSGDPASKPVESADPAPAPVAPAKKAVSLAAVPKDKLEANATEVIAKAATSYAWRGDGPATTFTAKSAVVRGKVVSQLLAGDKVISTIESGVEEGDIHEQAVALVGPGIDGSIAFVGGSRKITGKETEDDEIQYFQWNGSGFSLARTIKLSQGADLDER